MPEANKLDELTQFASDLQLMSHRAINLHLYATGKRLEWAIRMLGFEISGTSDGCNKDEAAPTRQTVLSPNGRDLVRVEG